MATTEANATGRTDSSLVGRLDDLTAFMRQCWRDDLAFREQAKHDPAMAALLAEADAKYEAENGHPWVNPLTIEAI